ncbi:MAG TPA: hypothetical protein VKU37_09315, partial [Verrucomicrobiae bacterium]|nr:hypothetical protein [Verrucomicrobiae bacterium]
TLPTVPGQEYLLSYWWETIDAGLGVVPNELKVVWNGTVQLDQTNVGVSGWTNQRLLVAATSSSSSVLFGLANDNSFYALDDISVVPVATPVLQRLSQSGSGVNLSWSTVAGLNYRLQYRTNLTQGAWINLGGPIAATSQITTTGDTVGTNSQRFYRIQLIP